MNNTIYHKYSYSAYTQLNVKSDAFQNNSV